MNLDTFFKQLTMKFNLGELLSCATKVSGGLMHNMYKLTTTRGPYAAKLLNPNIMQRPDALGNFNKSDRLEKVLEENNIPIIPSLVFDGKKMQEIDGQYFYLYAWYDGSTLKGDNITKYHCQKISKALSDIHSIDTKANAPPPKQITIDWNGHLALAKAQNSTVHQLLHPNIELLYTLQNEGNKAICHLSCPVSICHNDMDCKNVLWQGNDFKIIDLECLGYANPYLELFELALCWAGLDNCTLDLELFKAFITAYFKNKKPPILDWKSLYYSNYNRLEWLEYNVKRALLIECDSLEEQALGLEQIKKR